MCVCVCVRNAGCNNPIGAKIIDGLVGCADRFVSQFLCGLELRSKHGDPSTASLEGSFPYPRTIYEGLTCNDPIDCVSCSPYANARSDYAYRFPKLTGACYSCVRLTGSKVQVKLLTQHPSLAQPSSLFICNTI